MTKPYQPEIRKITAGPNPTDGFATFVGQTIKIKRELYRCSNIIEDSQSFSSFGVKRYNIYLIKEGTETEILWKCYENVPVSIEYDTESKSMIIS